MVIKAFMIVCIFMDKHIKTRRNAYEIYTSFQIIV